MVSIVSYRVEKGLKTLKAPCLFTFVKARAVGICRALAEKEKAGKGRTKEIKMGQARVLDWEHYAQTAIQAVSEGIVLLRNENRVLPLARGERVAVFGRIQLNYYKSGTGSGGMVNVSKVVGITDALLEGGAVVSDFWWDGMPYFFLAGTAIMLACAIKTEDMTLLMLPIVLSVCVLFNRNILYFDGDKIVRQENRKACAGISQSGERLANLSNRKRSVIENEAVNYRRSRIYWK